MKSGKDVKQDLKTADDLVNQLKRIYNDGYTAHAIDITKHFVHHVKGQGYDSAIKVQRVSKIYIIAGSEFTNLARPDETWKNHRILYLFETRSTLWLVNIDPKRYFGQIGPKHR